MLETLLLILVAFALPIPLWLILLHLILLQAKGIFRKISYFSLGLLWLISLIIIFNNKELIFDLKFKTNIILQILSIIFLILALLIDYFTVKALGYKKLSCYTELKNKQDKDQLITKGIYKYARHPRYIEYILLSLFFALFFGYKFFIYFTIYIFIGFYIATIFEEKELIKRFGNSYIEYKKKVPRFFIKLK